jgi:heptosyltransferase III
VGKRIDLNGKRIVISRTDSIGDVMLTLPMTAWLKERFPECHITFLCRSYTERIVKRMKDVDETLLLETLQEKSPQEQIAFVRSQHFDAAIHVFPRKELAKLFKKAGIECRVGTSHRSYHWFTCNVRPSFSRKRSPHHEAQLNFELLRPFGLDELPQPEELNSCTAHFTSPDAEMPGFIPPTGYVVLHPKSQGSAREWPAEKYMQLAGKLAQDGRMVVFTGTEKEGLLFRGAIPKDDQIIDSTGKLSIDQLITLISRCDAIVACSTGPLHIGGFLNRCAIGLYSPRVPIHPGRWKPLGNRTRILVADETCPQCAAGKDCDCLAGIPVERVLEEILNCR